MAKAGNSNARGNGYKQKRARGEGGAADERRLDYGARLGVRTLIAMLESTKSTNRDRIGAAGILMDRRYPKLTNADVQVGEIPPVILKFEGLKWPAPQEDKIALRTVDPAAVLREIKAQRAEARHASGNGAGGEGGA